MNVSLKEFVQQKKVVVHLGAHKTATTYIQSALSAQREVLELEGTALVLPSDLRPNGVLRRTFGADGQKTNVDQPGPDLATVLDDISTRPEIRQITISEENIIGSSRKNLARKSIYPDLRQRLKAMPRALDHPNITFLLALRDYGSFISSNVTTAVRRGNVFDPEELRTAFLALHRNWIDVINDLREVFPSAQLKIWRHEQFQMLEKQIFAELAGGAVPPHSSPRFMTLSSNAVSHIVEHIDPKSEAAIINQTVKVAARKFPVSAKNPPFNLWSEEQAAHLTKLYERDWQNICSTFPDIALRVGYLQRWLHRTGIIKWMPSRRRS